MRHKTDQPKKSQGKYGNYRQYDQESLVAAYNAVKAKKMSIRMASREFCVPETTLGMRVRGKISIDTEKPGPPTLLLPEDEQKLVEHIQMMVSVGYGFTRSLVLDLATNYAKYIGKLDSDAKRFSLQWYYLFCARHKELDIRQPKAYDKSQAQIETVSRYFEELGKVLDEYDLRGSPRHILIVEENSICMDHQPPKVVSGRQLSAETIFKPSSSVVTFISGADALGTAIPPYFVFPAKRFDDSLMNGAIPGAMGTVSESGLSTEETFQDYIHNHLPKFLQGDKGKYSLILYNGHKLQVNLSLIEWAKGQNVILFVLPPQMSHVSFPMDLGCFGLFASAFHNLCYTYRKGGRPVTMYDICVLACSTYTQALCPENITAAFKAAGVYPFKAPAVQVHKKGAIQRPRPKNTQSKPVYGGETESPAESSEDESTSPDTYLTSSDSDLSRPSSPEMSYPARVVTQMLESVETMKPGQSLQYTAGPMGHDKKSSSKRSRKYSPSQRSKAKKPKTSSSPGYIRRPQGRSPQPGFHDSSSDESEDSEVCCVCNRFQPKESEGSVSLAITDWAQCTMCRHWTHLRYCTPVPFVGQDDHFFCPHCDGSD